MGCEEESEKDPERRGREEKGESEGEREREIGVVVKKGSQKAKKGKK